jgi:hypothetical protein
LPDEMRDYFARLHALGVAVLTERPIRAPRHARGAYTVDGSASVDRRPARPW